MLTHWHVWGGRTSYPTYVAALFFVKIKSMLPDLQLKASQEIVVTKVTKSPSKAK